MLFKKNYAYAYETPSANYNNNNNNLLLYIAPNRNVLQRCI